MPGDGDRSGRTAAPPWSGQTGSTDSWRRAPRPGRRTGCPRRPRIPTLPEAREADIGVAAGNGKGQIFKKGETIATVQESDIVEAIVHFAQEMADEIRAERGEGQPVVVS